MGNRAHVIFHDPKNNRISPAIYLHWNGGPESIYAFLDELERRGVRNDTEYTCARFCHVVGDFMDQEQAGGLSLGIVSGPRTISTHSLESFDNGDNGVYVVSWENSKRIMRRFTRTTYDSSFKELPFDKVESEREEAYKHKYITDPEGIPAVFKKLRPNIEKR